MSHLLIPGVQHQHRGRVDSLLPYLMTQGLPGTAHQQAIQLAAVGQDQPREAIRQPEDHLEVRDAGQDQLPRLLHPIAAPGSGTQRAMPVATRIVDLASGAAGPAHIRMPAQRLGAAQQQLGENTLDLESQLAWPAQEAGSKLPDQVDHPRRRLRFARGRLPELRRWGPGG